MKRKVRRKKEGNRNGERLKWIHSIRIKLIAAFMIPVALLILLGSVSFLRASSGIKENYEDAMNATLNMMNRYFETVSDAAAAKNVQLTRNETLAKYYGGAYSQDAIEQTKKAKEMSSLIYATAMTEKNISEIYVIAETGKPMGAINNLLPADIYDQFIQSEEYENVKDLGNTDTIWLGYHRGLDAAAKKTPDDYSIYCVRRLLDQYGSKVGFIIVDLSKEFIVDTLAGSELPEGSIAIFETPDGRELTYGTVEDGSFSLDKLSHKAETDGEQYVNYNGETYLFLEKEVAVISGKIYTLIPQKAIILQAELVKEVTVAIVAVGVCIGILLAALLAREIGTAIGKVNRVLRKSSEGDLTVLVQDRRKDEFHLLSSCVNAMMNNMRGIVARMFVSSDNVFHSSKHMSEVSNRLVGVSEGIQAAATEIGGGVSEQALNTQNCLEQMNELAGMITEIFETMTRVDGIVEHTSQVVLQGIETVSELRKMDMETAEVTDRVIMNVEQLYKNSEIISGFVEMINAIAESTSLLSLNASIEAARAGEAGKGFAVVAGEIHKLAAQSEDASKEIGEIIFDMQRKTGETVESARQAKLAVESQEITLNSTVEMFQQIKETVSVLADNMESIVGQMKKMEYAKTQTLVNIENISAMAEQTASVTEQLEENSKSQLFVAEALKKSAKQMDEESQAMRKIISKFKV